MKQKSHEIGQHGNKCKVFKPHVELFLELICPFELLLIERSTLTFHSRLQTYCKLHISYFALPFHPSKCTTSNSIRNAIRLTNIEVKNNKMLIKMPLFIFVILIQFLKVVESVESEIDTILINRDEANSFIDKEHTRNLLTKRQLKNSKLTHVNRRYLKTRCNAGSWFEENWWPTSDKCYHCGKGRYQDKNGHYDTRCKDCPTGQWQNQNGQHGCKHCPTGQYQNSNVQAVCKHCPTGKYQNQNVQAGCKHCPTGQYQNQNAQAGCKHCPTGQYQNQNVQDGCKGCPTGQYQNQNNIKTGCKHCPGGQYQNQNVQAGCKHCPTGQYQNQNNIKTGCKHCLGGQYQNQNAQAGCKHCPTGQYQNQNVQVQGGCKGCPTGQYQDQNFKTNCKDCTGGTLLLILQFQASVFNVTS
jgi:hypothetical protein